MQLSLLNINLINLMGLVWCFDALETIIIFPFCMYILF